MIRPGSRGIRIVIALILFAVALVLRLAAAQQPSVVQPFIIDGVSVITPELEHPRGFLVTATGQLFIALAGGGGSNPGTGLLPDGPLSGGLTGSVVLVDEGCVAPLATSLPSVTSAMGRTWGVADVAIVGDQLYALVAGGGAAHGNPSDPNGIYRIGSDQSVTLIADLSKWQVANPVASPPKLDSVPDGMPYSMAAVDGSLWVTERHHGQLIRVGIDGAIDRMVDFSSNGLVPAGITPSPLGGAYIALVGSPPYPAGTARIVSVAPDGVVSDVWTGLTAAADVAVGPDGTLYALELGIPQSLVPPYLASQSGQIVRQTGPDRSALVARNLEAPSALAIDSDGGIFVSLSAISPQGPAGMILRIDPALEAAVSIPQGPWPAPTCVEDGDSPPVTPT